MRSAGVAGLLSVIVMAPAVAPVTGAPTLRHSDGKSATKLGPPEAIAPPPPPPPADLDPYRGLATWVDIYDKALWRNPTRAIAKMKAVGVRTLFLQTSNYSRPFSVFEPHKTAEFIREAHASGMSVIAWYLPGLANVNEDFRRSIAAIRFGSGSAKFDSFGMDIEASIVYPASRRSRRLLMLSARVRRNAPTGYALGAIIPSPEGMSMHPGYWRDFPYRGLASIYNVFVPMGYYTYHAHGQQNVHDDTVGNIQIIRAQTGNPTEPIHEIGGIAGGSSDGETRGFVHAVREYGALGASLYNFGITHTGSWPNLETVPVNPVETPPSPLPVPASDELGNIPGSDTSHPKEVFYTARGSAGDHTLSFEPFDAQPAEIAVYVNWHKVGTVQQTANGEWGTQQSIVVSDGDFYDTGINYIQFEALGVYPDWNTWGVRSVSII